MAKFLLFHLFFVHSSSLLPPPLDALAVTVQAAATPKYRQPQHQRQVEREREAVRATTLVIGGRGAGGGVDPTAERISGPLAIVLEKWPGLAHSSKDVFTRSLSTTIYTSGSGEQISIKSGGNDDLRPVVVCSDGI